MLSKFHFRRKFSSISVEKLPKRILSAQYAVRGEVVIRAGEIEEDLKRNPGKYPFSQMVPCNIGNPQAVGQKPLTFPRQVLSVMSNPALLDANIGYKDDVLERAKHYLDGVKRIGAYSHSAGHAVFREDIADYMRRRDGVEASINDIYITDGASSACNMVLNLVCNEESGGVMIPIPQYPLYTASLSLLESTAVPYYLNEETAWSFDMNDLVEARKRSTRKPTALVVINPGNPTGGVLTRKAIEEIIAFAEREGMAILADEVYQDNVYGTVPFTSFRKVAIEMGTSIEIFSCHSISKGFLGECGLRGGWVHLHNVDEKVAAQIYKLMSINLCSNTIGQTTMALSSRPPVEGDPSFELYAAERDAILSSLKRKAVMLEQRLNAAEGISCQPVNGAMYAFPSIELPAKYVEFAATQGRAADAQWCMDLLEATGVICVPGSGFGQREGTYHFRITILPDEPTLARVLDQIATFHQTIHSKFA